MKLKNTDFLPAEDEDLLDVEDLLRDVVCSMVDREGDVRIEFRYPSLDLVSADIFVHESEVGLVLGAKGSRSRALQEIFNAVYGKLRRRLTLYVAPTGPRRERRR